MQLLPHNFNAEQQMAGKKWYYAFMKRHPTLSYRQPEATSMARAKGFKETLQAAKEKARAKAVPAKRKCFGDNEGKGKSEKKLKVVEKWCNECVNCVMKTELRK
ncbi:hypothetical protein C0J52_21606 [Blattella germanica]|nr:hypothetical protein C0J52_21606 [Blattella germanica]